MHRTAKFAGALTALGVAAGVWSVVSGPAIGHIVESPDPDREGRSAAEIVAVRRLDDLAAMETFRPGFAFWQHVFVLPDHSIAYGSAIDGRLLVTFPTKGDWARDGNWAEPALERILDGQTLARRLSDRRDEVARLLESAVGPVLHNATRGDALLPNVRKYRTVPRRMGSHLRAVRGARGRRSRSGHSRIRAEPDAALGS